MSCILPATTLAPPPPRCAALPSTSFSPRHHPRPAEFLYNAKRSLVFFEMLQAEGVPPAPRLAWISAHDARRAARWCNEQEAVELVAMDLAVKQPREWANQLRLLRR